MTEKEKGWADPLKDAEEVQEPEKQELEQEHATEESGERERDDAERVVGRRAERRIKALTRKWKTAEEILTEERARRTDLESKIEALQKEFAEIRKGGTQATEVALREKYQGAMSRLKKAKEDGNYDEEIRATSDVADAQARWAIHQREKESPEEKVEEKAEVREQTSRPAQLRERAQEWVDEQKWWKKDRVLRATAIEIARELEEDGYDPDADEMYEALDKRLKEEAPQKFRENGKGEAVSGRRSGVAVQGKDARGLPILNDREKALSKKWGMTEEQFKLEKRRVEKAKEDNNGYTEIDLSGAA